MASFVFPRKSPRQVAQNSHLTLWTIRDLPTKTVSFYGNIKPLNFEGNMLGYETPGCQWQMKVYIGIPDPKNVIVLVVTGMLGGAFPRNMYTIASYATSDLFFD